MAAYQWYQFHAYLLLSNMYFCYLINGFTLWAVSKFLHWLTLAGSLALISIALGKALGSAITELELPMQWSVKWL